MDHPGEQRVFATAAARRLPTPMAMPALLLASLLHGLRYRLRGGQQLRIGNVRSEPGDYAEIEALLQAGAVQPHIAQVLPLERAAEALGACERGGVAGKVALRVTGE